MSLRSDPPLRPAADLCPACGNSRRRALGPIRYGVNALVADQDASALVGRLGRIDLVECQGCGFSWTDPACSMDAVLDLYRQNQETHWDEAGRDWGQHIDRLRPFITASGSALDVGCYTGDFLTHLDDGWERHGIEPIPYAAQVARKRGIVVREDALFDVDFPPGTFDLITLWDVVEHLPIPLDSFSRIADWLRPGGVLALETGNIACGLSRALGPDWWYVALIEHCSFYTVESLRRLFDRCGLRLETAIPTCHHEMNGARKQLQLAKAALYRAVSRASSCGAPWAGDRFAGRILRKHAPCALVKDHLFVVARRPGPAFSRPIGGYR